MASELLTSDRHDRRLKDLRISVTDRCNFRCTYCMPDDEYLWFARREILSFEEISRLARLFVALGVDKIRLTGGEPLIRRDLDTLIRQLAAIDGLQDLCLTTNGSLLAEKAEGLMAAGLKRLNVSLDTLDPQKFARIRRRGDLGSVLDGLFAARAAGFRSIKLNAVIERGVNEDDILPLVEFAREHGFTMRFIEYMDVGNANRWLSEKMVPKREILETIHARHPLREAGRQEASAPAVDYKFEDGLGTVGFIASVTEPFCGGCTRARLTADGKLVTCLFAESGHDLKGLLRSDASDAEITRVISGVWGRRDDRYSDERLEAMRSPAGYEAKERRKLEMITLGG
jgi:cyclic pyranopterin phosphate synthase